jgi:hypothetical protein
MKIPEMWVVFLMAMLPLALALLVHLLAVML